MAVTRLFMDGWLVSELMLLMAVSTMSTPASAAIIRAAIWLPLVSWVCRWMGRSVTCLSSVTSFLAASGRSRPPISLMQRISAPIFSSSLA